MRRFATPVVKDAALVSTRREQIAETALQLFKTRGYHNTAVREVAQAAGVSVGSLFNYFRSKEEILHFIYDQVHVPIEDALQDLMSKRDDPETALRRALEQYFRLIDQHQDHAILVYQEFKSLDARAKRELIERERRIMEIFQRLIEAGIKQKQFRQQSLVITVNTIMALGHFWALRRWAFKHTVSLEEFTNAQIHMVLAGLRENGDLPVTAHRNTSTPALPKKSRPQAFHKITPQTHSRRSHGNG